MEAQSAFQSLPRRQYDTPVKFHSSQKKNVVTNYFQIKFGSKDNCVYQFTFDAEPQIPQDSKEILFQLIRSIRKQLKEKIGLVTSSGLMIWGVKKLNIPLNIKTQFKYNDQDFKFDVLIKPTKTLQIDTLIKTSDGFKMVLQIYNNKLKNILRQNKMDQVTRGKYFDKKQTRVQSVGLNIIRGYKFTLSQLKSGINLQIDVCSRVYRAANLLEQIIDKKKDYVQNLVGSTVITRYGKIRTYTIQRIDYKQSPKSQFYHEKREGKVSYAQYYKEAYGLKVQDMTQPLLQVILRVQKNMLKNGVMNKVQVKGFLIPQFVSLTGMSDQQKSNFQTMKQIAPMTKLTPDQRLGTTNDLINKINCPDFQIGRPRTVTGYQLDDPEVFLASKNIYRAKDGSLNFKDKVKQAIKFKDWAIVYSQGKNAKYDDQDADNLVGLIREASIAFGIEFSSPGFITCDNHIQSWKRQIEEDVKKNGKPQIIVLFLTPPEEKLYGQLKRFITCDLKICCQGIKRKTIGPKSKNPMSAASKIIIQMNQKVGGITWQVVKGPQYFAKRKIMYGAFSISKGKKGFTVAFVGTINPQSTKVYNYCKTGYKRKQDIPQADFDQIFLNWARSYVQQNKQGPQSIIIYREGLSIPQIEVQIKPQITALKGVIKTIGEKTKKPNYNPDLIYLTVNKKINTRIFDATDRGGSQGKFLPRVNNPSSGTCVFQQISVDKLTDFHLAAQKVTQGTCTPTHYIIVYNQSKVEMQDLAQFTYEQCFNYYNWQGAVKVPACLQCADKLAKLVGESIQANVVDGEVTKSFYFL